MRKNQLEGLEAKSLWLALMFKVGAVCTITRCLTTDNV